MMDFCLHIPWHHNMFDHPVMMDFCLHIPWHHNMFDHPACGRPYMTQSSNGLLDTCDARHSHVMRRLQILGVIRDVQEMWVYGVIHDFFVTLIVPTRNFPVIIWVVFQKKQLAVMQSSYVPWRGDGRLTSQWSKCDFAFRALKHLLDLELFFLWTLNGKCSVHNVQW